MSSSDFKPLSDHFICTGRINLQGGRAVYQLAFSPDGKFLACGGEFGACLIHIETTTIQKNHPAYDLRVHGAVMAMEWVGNTLVLGSAYGYMKIWGLQRGVLEEWHTFRVAEGTEVTSLAIRGQPARFKLAVATRDHVVVRLDITPDEVTEIFAVQLEKTFARTVVFTGDRDDIQLLGMFDGMMYTLKSHEGKLKISKSRSICRLVGYASFDSDHREVLVDNTDAFAIHSTELGSCLNVFSTGRPTWKIPKQVVFAEGGQTVIVGSDHGDVYVFDRAGGHPQAVLHHQDTGYTQTIATCSTGNGCLVACGTSLDGVPSSVSIWKSKPADPLPSNAPLQNTSSESPPVKPSPKSEPLILRVVAWIMALWMMKYLLTGTEMHWLMEDLWYMRVRPAIVHTILLL
ncbi:WD40 repeat-like protein [Punctularia strigosozonata HHB-11173 SS5]|uniref:WD40 repeat-like protein n=1 Tax=Punctularia strigosozonata (strain HHB-11173) TaxID=741275 RepID=UPI000441807E|nr:WD40 repeat-like protein [Punctularia strigosozonata HHB-11173 SS5]EIN13259.1 WD40 repeat-like protein [Punctularia strigosozonata HHB-11173 SS5]